MRRRVFTLSCLLTAACAGPAAKEAPPARAPAHSAASEVSSSQAGPAKKAEAFNVAEVYFSHQSHALLYVDLLRNREPGVWGYHLHLTRSAGRSSPELSVYDCDREPRGCDGLLRLAQRLRDEGAYVALPYQPWPQENGKPAPLVRKGILEFSWEKTWLAVKHGDAFGKMFGTSDRDTAPTSLHVLESPSAQVVTFTRAGGSTYRAVFREDGPRVEWDGAPASLLPHEPSRAFDDTEVYFSEKTHKYLYVDAVVQPETGRACTLVISGDRPEDLSARPASSDTCRKNTIGYESLVAMGARLAEEDHALRVPATPWPKKGDRPVPILSTKAFEFQWSGSDFRIVRRATGAASPPVLVGSTASFPVSVHVSDDEHARTAVITLGGSHENTTHNIVVLP